MIQSDSENLGLVDTVQSVDSINAKFYGAFPYPWTPMTFSYLTDDLFEARMLNQDIGDYGHQTMPGNPRIWVAGCGTNQAVYTALRFPRATVLGSDLSAKSLELCDRSARDLNIRHLELACESINNASYQNHFHYIVCTGVVHHNAAPQAALDRLAAALKPGGVLELMVYNRYHRTNTTAFQKALRVINGAGADFGSDLEVTRQIIASIPLASPMAAWLPGYKEAPEAALADALMQPVEHSYTVHSLNELAESCGLELLQPCVSQFDKADGRISWNLQFPDLALQTRYDSLADVQRWYVTNLLMLNRSPMLWFYLRRRDERRRATEAEICERFLDTVFIRSQAMRRTYRRADVGRYKLSPHAVSYPATSPEQDVAPVLDMVDGKTPMRDIFARLRMTPGFHVVNRIRTLCATSAFPYLLGVS